MSKRKQHAPEFKAKVALDGLNVAQAYGAVDVLGGDGPAQKPIPMEDPDLGDITRVVTDTVAPDHARPGDLPLPGQAAPRSQ